MDYVFFACYDDDPVPVLLSMATMTGDYLLYDSEEECSNHAAGRVE